MSTVTDQPATKFAFRVTEACRELGLRPGDSVCIRPNHFEPMAMVRQLPTTTRTKGLLVRLMLDGKLVDFREQRPGHDTAALIRYLTGLEVWVPRESPTDSSTRLQLVP